ncbi:MAG: adenylate/guanylate cyclase domain-containing protein [Roseibium sp.]
MAQEILPPGNASVPEPDSRPTGHGHPPHQQSGKRGFRVSVGVALGFVFSVLLVVICGVIITYMAASDRRIAGRLLDEQGVAVLKRNETILLNFFQEQEVLLKSIAVQSNSLNRKLDQNDLNSYQHLLPSEAEFGLQTSADEGSTSEVRWRPFEYREGFATGIKTAELKLGNGQTLLAFYPQPVFAALSSDMIWEDRQNVFMLSGKDRAIVVDGLPETAFRAQPDVPLPELASLTETPLHLIWKPQPRAFNMGGSMSGRVFPGLRGMYTAIFAEISSGPAKGWHIGMLYEASKFGAALDQTRIVLYAALVALVVGALLSFMVGRMLGRPLTRLAQTAADLRQLDFSEAERLPRSRLAELDDVNQAFNGSIGALNAFAKYVPRQLVSRLIEEGMTDTRNIELREMTIVFTDLAGFTNMASHLSAEETAAYLNGYFETVSTAIAEQNGTIDKFLGDGVMAFWGAPSDQPDHAAKAISAAKALADHVQSDKSGNMRIRIGIHTGKVVVGDIGSAARMNYTVIGDAVNVAARLQEYGKQVDADAKVIALASGETMSQLPEGASATSLGSVQLRGRDDPLTIFRIA